MLKLANHFLQVILSFRKQEERETEREMLAKCRWDFLPPFPKLTGGFLYPLLHLEWITDSDGPVKFISVRLYDSRQAYFAP